MSLKGPDAIAMGFVCASIALFLFAHYFCSNSNVLYRLTDAGKVVSLLVFVASLGYIMYNFVLG